MIFARVFIPFAMGYLLSYLLRVINSVIAPSLINGLGLSASDLGLLTSANLFAFAAFQLPLGVLLDRYGPRKAESVLLLIAAIGCAIFALSGSMALLMMGRALMGLGTSACLMAAFTAYALFLPKEKLPSINAYQMMAGGAGALLGTTPVELLDAEIGWRGVFWIAACFAVVMSAVIYFVVPRRHEKSGPQQTWGEAIGGVKDVFTSPVFWRIAPACVVCQASFIGIQSLWLGPWFHDVLGFDARATADALFWVAAAMIFGNLCVAWIAGYLSRRGVDAIRISMVGMTVFTIIQTMIVLGIIPPSLQGWMVWVFMATYANVCYAGLTLAFPTALAGRVLTGLNLLVFFAAFVVQWGVGVIIDLWPCDNGRFDPEGYTTAFAVISMAQVAALLWFVVFRPKVDSENLM
jgi:MFS family permease